MRTSNPTCGYHRRLRAAKNLIVLDRSLHHHWQPVVGKRKRVQKSNLHAKAALPHFDVRRPMAQILDSLWAKAQSSPAVPLNTKQRVRTALQVILEAQRGPLDEIP